MIKYYWQKQITLSEPKIKLCFSKTPEKMQDIIQDASDDITNDDTKQIYIYDIQKKKREYGILVIEIYFTSKGNYIIFQS